MARDHNKLRVFHLADALAFDIYQATKAFPADERYELTRQIRRAALSVPTNLVEGCARLTQKAYCNFCDIALGSACETKYLLEFSKRLGYLKNGKYNTLHDQADKVVRSLSRLVGALDEKRRDRRLARWKAKTARLRATDYKATWSISGEARGSGAQRRDPEARRQRPLGR